MVPNSNDRWIAFDFDGTIADTKGFLLDLYNSRLSQIYGGRTVAASELDHLASLPFHKILAFLKVSPFKLPFMIRRARREIGLNIESIPLIAGMAELLPRLAAEGYKIAVISSNNAENIARCLAIHGITAVSEIACDTGASLFVKAKTIHRFMKKHALQPAQILYVGDEVRDIVASRREGIAVISVTWGFDPAVELRKHEPDFVAEVVEGIVEGVRLWGGLYKA